MELVTLQVNRQRRQRRAREPGPIIHGTLTAYAARRCRCLECRERWRTYYRDRRAKLRAQGLSSRRRPLRS
jgi:hypothetical protein